jgi:hypothetical protein
VHVDDSMVFIRRTAPAVTMSRCHDGNDKGGAQVHGAGYANAGVNEHVI